MKKNIVIALLCLCVVSILGFMFYSFNEKDKKVNELKEENTSLKNQVSNLNTSKGLVDKFVGKYEYVKTDTHQEMTCTTIYRLEVNKNGTGNYFFGNTCASSSSGTGSFSINDNNMYLIDEECASINEAKNCPSYLSYKYEGNKIITNNTYTNSEIELQKVDKFTEVTE